MNNSIEWSMRVSSVIVYHLWVDQNELLEWTISFGLELYARIWKPTSKQHVLKSGHLPYYRCDLPLVLSLVRVNGPKSMAEQPTLYEGWSNINETTREILEQA